MDLLRFWLEILMGQQLGFIDVYHSGDEHNCCGCETHGHSAEEARFPDTCKRDVLIIIDRDSPSRGWPGAHVMGLSYDQFYRTFDRALADWNKHVGIRLSLTDDRDRFPEALCKVVFWNFGGGVLADSHLADNTCDDNKRQRYDHRTWTEHLLYLTVLHEVGHLIGLHHQSGAYIMNPTILTGLNGLTETDIKRARNLGYGGPLGEPDPVPPVPPKPKPPEGPNVDWIALIELLMPIIKECLARDSDAVVANRIKSGGFIVALRLYRGFRKQGLKAGDAKARTKSALAELAATPTEDIQAMLAEVKDWDG